MYILPVLAILALLARRAAPGNAPMRVAARLLGAVSSGEERDGRRNPPLAHRALHGRCGSSIRGTRADTSRVLPWIGLLTPGPS